ncbi:hypothetical protein [Rubrivirga marina]|uniref:DUF4397 domain-containing protein n=1 Tax=Rubrivirga marina TaxID=1196024 RepID=A0A271IWK3_9BACT|nr:hypothetical protein [Rubrivirga marina]PAP75194.1 hypothetical protein BSZ37_01415 [Rubrivirga marina]
MKRLAFGLALCLVALALQWSSCAGSPGSSDAPAVSPDAPAVETPLPVVTVSPGRVATVDMSRYASVVFEPPAGIDVDVSEGGEASIRVGDGFRGLDLVPFAAGSQRYAVAVQNPTGSGRLALDRVGIRPDDPSVLDLDLRQFDADGQRTELTVDEDTGVVVLLGDRVASDNSVDLDPATGRLGVDLDVAGPGAHRLRVAARADGLVSEWVAVDVVDGRLAE